MSDNVTVEVGGKSKYETALIMARRIFELEKKTPTKHEYLKTIEECIFVLNGGSAPKQ